MEPTAARLRTCLASHHFAVTLAFVDPATRFRRALATCGPSSPSLEFLVRLADRVPPDGHVRYRNTDPQTRATSLHLAAARGRLDLVRWLLDEGVDQAEVSRDVLGDTVLHVAAAHGHVAILDAYLDHLPFVLTWVNSRGMTPLHVAAMKGEYSAALVLVDAGSDVDAPDLEGNSPLHFAASWGHVPIIKLLLDRGCDADMRNADGFSPAEFAYSFGVLKDLETLIRQRAEQAKADDRAARRTKSRANSQTLRAKRTGSQSMLSIALPPMPSAGVQDDDDGERSASSSFVGSPDPASFGLGLTQLANANGLPRLGAPIPPTPQAGASAFLRSTAPLSTPDSPGEPHTPSSLYPNTTSPQPSPLPSPASVAASRPTTPKPSPTMFRRYSSRASSASLGSVATSAAPLSSPVRDVAPSPASGASSAGPQQQHATPESVQTATPTPASPTPASTSGWARRPAGSLSSAAYQSAQPGAYAASPVVAHYAPQGRGPPSPAAPPAHGPSPATAAPPPPHPPLPLEYLPPLSPPQSPPPHSPPPPTPSPSPSPAHAHAHNKLVRKSRSHAHAPSLSSAAQAQAHAHGVAGAAGADPAPLGLLLPPGAQAGQRSASGPALGRSSAEWASGTGTGSSGRSSFDVAEAVVHDLRERERERERERTRGGHKLRKEHHARRGSEASGAGTVGDKPHGGRLARVLGLRK